MWTAAWAGIASKAVFEGMNLQKRKFIPSKKKSQNEKIT
jgi:hypothetical protein